MVWNKVLVLAPHTDDAELGAGGFVSKLVSQSVDVYSTAFSIARQSVPEGFPEDILAKEVKHGNIQLGIPESYIEVLDFPVRRFPEYRQDILEHLVRLKREINPDMVLIPTGMDVHQDHYTLYGEAVRAFKDRTILGYELPWNMIETRSQLVVALEQGHIDNKVMALSAYQSQSHRSYMKKEFIYSWAQICGIKIGVPFAEVFEVIRWVIR